jgi:hypothetical protein
MSTSVLFIGRDCFMACRSLDYIKGLDKLETIPKNYFNGCSESVELTLTFIAFICELAFRNCENLQNLSINLKVSSSLPRLFTKG